MSLASGSLAALSANGFVTISHVDDAAASGLASDDVEAHTLALERSLLDSGSLELQLQRLDRQQAVLCAAMHVARAPLHSFRVLFEPRAGHAADGERVPLLAATLTNDSGTTLTGSWQGACVCIIVWIINGIGSVHGDHAAVRRLLRGPVCDAINSGLVSWPANVRFSLFVSASHVAFDSTMLVRMEGRTCPPLAATVWLSASIPESGDVLWRKLASTQFDALSWPNTARSESAPPPIGGASRASLSITLRGLAQFWRPRLLPFLLRAAGGDAGVFSSSQAGLLALAGGDDVQVALTALDDARLQISVTAASWRGAMAARHALLARLEPVLERERGEQAAAAIRQVAVRQLDALAVVGAMSADEARAAAQKLITVYREWRQQAAHLRIDAAFEQEEEQA